MVMQGRGERGRVKGEEVFIRVNKLGEITFQGFISLVEDIMDCLGLKAFNVVLRHSIEIVFWWPFQGLNRSAHCEFDFCNR